MAIKNNNTFKDPFRKQAPPPSEAPPVQPVEQEELFPGFQMYLADITKSKHEATSKLETAQSGLTKTQEIGIQHPLSKWDISVPGFFPSITGGIVSQADFDAEIKKWQAEIDGALNQYETASWREAVLYGLPMLLSDPENPIRSVEDVMKSYPHPNASDADSLWIDELMGSLEQKLLTQPTMEEEVDLTQTREQFLDDLLAEPKLELRAVHNLTIEELIKTFRKGPSEVVSGMSWDDISDLLKDDPEYLEYLQDIKAQSKEFQDMWAEQAAAIELIRTGVVQAEVPDLTVGEKFKMLFTQPALAASETLEEYFNALPRPLAAWAIINFPRIKKDSAAARLEENYIKYVCRDCI